MLTKIDVLWQVNGSDIQMRSPTGGNRRRQGIDVDTRLEGFEPTTPGSEDRCSCPLSYRRTLLLTVLYFEQRVQVICGL